MPEEEVVNQNDVETEVAETVETKVETSTPEEYDVIKYNSEEVKIPVSERQTYLQKGYNYDKVNQRVQELEGHSKNLERTAKFNGFDSTEQYLEALDKAEQDRNIQEEAAKAGMDEEQYRQYLAPVNEKLKSYEQKIQQLESADMNRQIQSELTQLKTDKDFAKYEEATINAWKTNPAFKTLSDAYEFVSYKDKLASTKETAEQETIRKLQQNGQSSAGSLGEGAVNHNNTVGGMGKSDFESLVNQVLRGERKQI